MKSIIAAISFPLLATNAFAGGVTLPVNPTQPLALESEITSANSAITALQGQVTTLQQQVTALQNGGVCANTTFCDSFATLDVGQHMDTTHKWTYVKWYGPPNWDGEGVNSGWMVNPLYSGTQINGLYGIGSSGLQMSIANAGSCTTACGNLPYVSSALVASNFKVTPNSYTEFTAKFPNVPGSAWALWLMGDGTNGHYQELDLVEAVQAASGSWTGAFQTVHYDGGSQDQYTAWAPGFSITAQHTYGVDWRTGGNICFYIDRAQTMCKPTPSYYTGPMYLLLSSEDGDHDWTGGGIPSTATLPAAMTVQNVRVWGVRPF
jgi:hypothetical protein